MHHIERTMYIYHQWSTHTERDRTHTGLVCANISLCRSVSGWPHGREECQQPTVDWQH